MRLPYLRFYQRPALLSALATLIGSWGHYESAFGQTTLSIGDVYVTGFNSNAPDGFGFVFLRDIAAGTDVRFTDNGFLSSGSANATNNGRGGENFLRWVAPAGGVTAGTVVRWVDGTGASVGTTPFGALNGISNGGDQIFIYQGAGAGTSTSTMDFGTNANPSTFTGTILNGLNFQGSSSATTWLTTGTASSNTSYLPSQLSGLNANTSLAASASRGNYSGVRTGLTATAYGHALSNSTNWTTASGAGTVTLTPTNFSLASSAGLVWDANGTTAGSGGSGTWDTSTQNRFSFTSGSDTSFMPWVNSSVGNRHTAVFGGTAGTVSVASGGVTASGLAFSTDGYTVQNNTVALTDSANVDVTASASSTISSQILGTSGLTKIGDGRLVLTGANTYSGGTTVADGELRVNNLTGSGVGLGNVSVQSGAILSGSGTIGGDTTIQNGGFHAPGTSPGTQTFENADLTYNSLSTLQWELISDTNSVITDFDRILGTGVTPGVLSISPTATSTLIFNGSGSTVDWDDVFWGSSKQWLVYSGFSDVFGDTVFVNPIVAGLLDGDGESFTDLSNQTALSNFTWSVSGNDVFLNYNFTAVPEPTSIFGAVGLAMVGVLRSRRRRTIPKSAIETMS